MSADQRQQKPRIVGVIPSLQPGGMERVMATLLKELSDHQGYRLDLVLYGRTRSRFFDLPAAVTVHSPAFDFDAYPRWLSTLRTMLFVRRTLARLQPDAVLSLGELWNTFVLIATLGQGHRITVSDRCQPTKTFQWYQEWLRRLLYPKAHRIVVQTELAREHYAKKFGVEPCTIGNPVAVAHPAKATARKKQVLNVARLIDTKHHDRLVRMFAATAESDWELVILGDDAQSQTNRNHLVELAAELGVAERVAIKGTVSDVEHYYQQASIFAFPSSSEGFPNALAEAMAHGMACVSYNCCAGPSDLIDNGVSGYLVPVFYDGAFSERLSLLMHDADRREEMGGAASRSMERFSAPRIAERYASAMLE